MNRFPGMPVSGPRGVPPAPEQRASRGGAGLAFLRTLVRSAYGLDGGTLSQTNVQALGGNAVLKNAPTSGAPIPPNDTTVQPTWMSVATIVRADAKRRPSPRVITVTLNPPVVPIQGSTGTAAFVIDIKARLQWGAGADTVTADVDCNDGTQVSVLGSFVQVSGIYTIFDPTVANGGALPVGAPAEVVVGAALSYGSRGSPGIGPSWSTYAAMAVSPAVGSVRNFIIPPFANSFSIYAIDIATDVSVPINFLFAGHGVNLGRFAQAANAATVYPIPGGAQSVTVSNPNAGATQVSLRFGLNL